MKIKEYPGSFFRSLEMRFFLRKSRKVYRHTHQADCVVSLTSIPNRLPQIELTIASLLAQSTPPKKIILWLNDSLQDALPRSLASLQRENFAIRFRQGNSSHRKLIFTLSEFSEDVIVTCDDDVMYSKNWLESLMADHFQHPAAVLCHECREVSHDHKGHLKPYREWTTITAPGYTAEGLVPIGYGGVLYPPRSLHRDTLNEALFMELAPKADDLWFRAMSYLQGTEVRKCTQPSEKPIPIIGAKGSSLAKTNIKADGNRQQWLAICRHYDINPGFVEPDCST